MKKESNWLRQRICPPLVLVIKGVGVALTPGAAAEVVAGAGAEVIQAVAWLSQMFLPEVAPEVGRGATDVAIAILGGAGVEAVLATTTLVLAKTQPNITPSPD